jgi:hypothetical protein
MKKYLLEALKLPEEASVTKDLVTDANMALFLTWMWKNEKSKQQVKKLQSYFKELRSQFKLVAPDSKSSPHEWSEYSRVLKSLQRTEEWKRKQTHKVTLDEDQDNFIVSELCGRITKAAEDEKLFEDLQGDRRDVVPTHPFNTWMWSDNRDHTDGPYGSQ